MAHRALTRRQLLEETDTLRNRLAEAEETLLAIHHATVDAFVVTNPDGAQIVTRDGTEYPYRLMVERMSEGAVTLIADGTIFYCNPRFARMVQTPAEGLLGSPFKKVVQAEEMPKFEALLANKGTRQGRQEFHLQGTNGAVIPVQISVRPLRIEQLDGLSLIITDITERKQGEQAMRAADLKYRSLVEQLPIVTYVIEIGGAGRTTYISPQVETVLGYTPAEWMADPLVWRKHMHPDDRDRVFAAFAEADITGAPVVLEYRFFTLGGEIVWLSGWSVPMPEEPGDIHYAQGFLMDITERKRAEEALIESERHYRQIIETAREGVWVIDPDNRTALANKRMADLLGYEVGEMPGRSLFEFMDAAGRAEAEKSLERGKLGIGEEFEFRFIRKDGGEVWTLLETSTLFDPQGKYMGALAMVTDITQRRQSEAKILRQLSQLSALHEIDLAIAGSLDLELTLGVVLTIVMAQLGVDAADILISIPELFSLVFSVGHGFQTAAIRNTRLRFGEGYSGRAAMERRLQQIPNLAAAIPDFTRARLLQPEKFVQYFGVPLIARGQVSGVLELYHRQDLPRSEDWFEFLNTLAGQVAIAIDSIRLFESLEKSNIELALAYDATIEGWSRALDLRDKETEGHSQRVTDMTVLLARRLGLSERELVHVRRGALLHDIGKMGVPDSILLKEGPLTEAEWIRMKRHPALAYEMLSPIRYMRPALDIPYCHHEKWDGTGYPRQLKGEQIPVVARLFAIVDVWDALGSDRPYRKAWEEQKVLTHIRELKGTHFEPAMVDAFLGLLASNEREASALAG